MVSATPRETVLTELAYALAVRTLVQQGKLRDPEPLIVQTHQVTVNDAAKHTLEGFERHSLVAEVQKIADPHGFWYGVWQGCVAGFLYSILLVVAAVIIKDRGIDILDALGLSTPK